MVDAQALVVEITSTAAFLRSRRNEGPEQETALKTNLATTLELQIGRLRQCTAQDATALNQALVDAPYGDENLRRIAAAIDTRLTGTAVRAQKSGSLKNDPQHLATPYYMMTKSDWAVFNDKRKPWDVKIGRCLFRLNMLGITHPSYQTIKWCIAMLLIAHYEVLPSHRDIFNKVQDFKAAAESERRPYPHGHMLNYPLRPHDLAEVMRAHAYEEGDPPIDVELDGIRGIAENHIPLRSNSKLLRAKGADRPTASVSMGGLQASNADSATALTIFDHGGGRLSVSECVKLEQGVKPERDSSSLSLGQSSLASSPLHLAQPVGLELVQPKAEHPKRQDEQTQPRAEEVPSTTLPGLSFGAPLGGAFAQRIALEVKDEIDHGTPKVEGEPKAMALDSYQAAAVEALRSRNEKKAITKKEEQKQARAAKAQTKEDEKLRQQAAKAEAKAKHKSDASKAKAAPKALAVKPETPNAEPAAPSPKRRRLAHKTPAAKAGSAAQPKKPKAERPDRVELSRKDALRVVPSPNSDGSDPTPLDYNGGRIYVSGKSRPTAPSAPGAIIIRRKPSAGSA